ncbi:hypothetical protein [Sphingomonas sp. R86521]|uniref:hypothetical protein n=1 Tax=Sphingomonas sp. R86521 TaxID=3093860 RepID=UPI0036D3AFAD
MDTLNIIVLIVAGLSLALIVVALVQINSLSNELTKIDERSRKAPRGPEQGGSGDRIMATLVNLSDQMRRIDLGVEALKRQAVRPPVRSAVEPAPEAVKPASIPTEAIRDPLSPVAAERISAVRSPSYDDSAVPFRAAAASRADASWNGSRSEDQNTHPRDEMLDEYRALIAQPRKTDIKRWIDERGGEVCEATEDGGFQPLGRDSSGLLVLLRTSEHTAVVLPGSRMIVDFPTDYANAISLRSVTRQSFDLVEDGSGVLRLLEPARAELRGGTWRLTQPGRLAGLKPD